MQMYIAVVVESGFINLATAQQACQISLTTELPIDFLAAHAA